MKNCIFFSLVLYGMCAAAVGDTQELKVVTENWRPYNFLEDGEVKGGSTDIVKQVLLQAEVPFTITVYPWARAYQMALRDPNTIIYTLIRIPQREHVFKWIRPLGKGGTTWLYQLKKSAVVAPKTIEEAKNYSVVANLDSMDHLWLLDQGFKHIYSPPKVENSIRMFFNGNRADFLAFDDSVIEEEFKNLGFDLSEVVKIIPLFKTPPYMAASLNTSDEMVARLQKAYDELLKANKIKLVN